MPYIAYGLREVFNPHIEGLAQVLRANPGVGNINYCLTRIVMIAGKPRQGDWDYKTLHDVIGILEDVKTEIQRRAMTKYEERKKSENGDVPEFMGVRCNG